jgi:UDP-3-O-[3-hydroxymyristoyl] glucosamine N-acyltransferase
MEFTVRQIAQMLSGNVVGDETAKIRSAAKIEEGQPGCISFLANQKYEPFIYTTQSSAVIVSNNFVPKKPVESALIYVEDPYAAFTKLLQEYEKLINGGPSGTEEPSFLGEGSQLGSNCYRGAFSYIGRNCRIGNNVRIYPNAYIGDNTVIGDNTTIHSGARLFPNTVVGKNCLILANAVLGSDGFGFAPQPDGSYESIPQLGNVVLEDNVCVGANTVIDRATMGSTIIRQGVKLDNLIQIAHNVEIGKNTVIAAQSGISGSTKVGEQCVIAGQVGIVGHIAIANRTKVGAQSGVGKSIKTEGLSINGSPARDIQENMRIMATTRRLPEIEKRLKELELNQQTTTNE